MMDITC